MNIFDQYGIKEVADVTLYSIHKKTDGSGDVYYVPALYLDTLKVSTVEKTAENTWAQGGLGNAKLINWDYNKEINVSLEDALCTPASLGLCWNGILSADWKNAQVDINTDVCFCKNPVGRIARMEKAIYPRTSNDPSEHVVSRLLPQTGNEGIRMDLLTKSEVVDGTRIQGVGQVSGHAYKWRLIVESGVRSVAQVPDRFFDIEGRSYPINWNSKVSVFNGEAPTASNFKDAIIYKIGDGVEADKPKPYIIFDGWMDNHGDEGTNGLTLSLQQYLTKYGYNAGTEKETDGTLVNSSGEDGANVAHNVKPLENEEGLEEISITEGKYLAIVVDNSDIYHAFIGIETTTNDSDDVDTSTDSKITWFKPKKAVNVNQFKGLDMWIRFSSINAMTYFILTKYGEDILSIIPSFRLKPPREIAYTYTVKVNHDSTVGYGTFVNEDKDLEVGSKIPVGATNIIGDIAKGDTILEIVSVNPYDKADRAHVNEETTEIAEYDRNTEEMRKTEGKLWAYVNPRTMQPFDDDYWFHQGEPYYIKSLTIAPKGKSIKGNRITIKADEWPGMYMMIGETYIRNRDTGEDERMQIKFPLCKVRSDQTITLEAEGEPTTFNLNLEVAKPRSGAMMEITAYEIATKMERGENGCFYAVDGSSEVVTE